MDNAKTKREKPAHSDGRKPRRRNDLIGTDKPAESTVYKVHDQEYYISGYLYVALMRMYVMLRKDWDIVIIVDGLERSGKSVLAQQIAYFLDPTFCIDRITFTADEFKAAIENASQYQAIILDEAMTALFSRQAMSGTNIDLVKSLAEVGQKNLVLIVVLPTFFDLDRYVAIHRSRCLIHTSTNRQLSRGLFSFYNMPKKKDLYLAGKSFYKYTYVSPNFKGRFTNHYTVDEGAYRKKKQESLKKSFETKDEHSITDMKRKWAKALREEGKTYKEIGKYLSEKLGYKVASRTIADWVKHGEQDL